MAYTMKGGDVPLLLCSCCPCCCHTLGSLVRNGLHTEILTSKYISQDDPTLCNDCGDCVERCVFQAREMIAGRLEFDSSKCFGCGLCVSACPTDAISLAPRSTA
jgi:MinD superfamily P-loop ATPase